MARCPICNEEKIETIEYDENPRAVQKLKNGEKYFPDDFFGKPRRVITCSCGFLAKLEALGNTQDNLAIKRKDSQDKQLGGKNRQLGMKGGMEGQSKT